MYRAMKLLPVLALVAVSFATARAEAQSVAGKWTAEYPTRVRMGNGAPSAEQMGSALLTLEVKGDSVFGTWAPQNTPAPVPPRKVKGTFKEGRINMIGDPTEATIRRGDNPGDESKVTMVTYFEGSIKDGAIDGLMYSESSDQSIKSSPIKWTAKLASDK
jgi:hypothetical protein